MSQDRHNATNEEYCFESLPKNVRQVGETMQGTRFFVEVSVTLALSFRIFSTSSFCVAFFKIHIFPFQNPCILFSKSVYTFLKIHVYLSQNIQRSFSFFQNIRISFSKKARL